MTAGRWERLGLKAPRAASAITQNPQEALHHRMEMGKEKGIVGKPKRAVVTTPFTH